MKHSGQQYKDAGDTRHNPVLSEEISSEIFGGFPERSLTPRCSILDVALSLLHRADISIAFPLDQKTNEAGLSADRPLASRPGYAILPFFSVSFILCVLKCRDPITRSL